MDKKKLKNNILIIGGTGFIGYHLAKKCLQLGWKVTSLSLNKPKNFRKLTKVRYLKGNISSKKSLKKINKNFDYVINLGGYVDHINKTKNYKDHFKGCVNLVNIFLNKKIKLFLQVGSGTEYEKKRAPHKENFVCNPKSIYARPKFLATNFLIKKHKQTNFPFTVVRLYQIFGEKQDSNRIIPFIIRSCLNDKDFPCSDGSQFRDFIHIDEVINAFIKILKNHNKVSGEIINIGSGKPIKLKWLIKKINSLVNKGKPVFGKIKMRVDEEKKPFPSIIKAKKILEWKPKNNFLIKLKKVIYHEKKNYTGN